MAVNMSRTKSNFIFLRLNDFRYLLTENRKIPDAENAFTSAGQLFQEEYLPETLAAIKFALLIAHFSAAPTPRKYSPLFFRHQGERPRELGLAEIIARQALPARAKQLVNQN